MNRAQALPYIGHCIDDALSPRDRSEMPDNARLVGWQCGFEPVFVAIWSYLDVALDDSEAIEIATDYLSERKWFADEPTAPDYVI